MLPHEIIHWLGRPVHENDISRIMGPYRDLLVCDSWYSNAASHVFKEYAKYAMKHHPRGDVADEVLQAVGKMFVWQCDELRFFDSKLKKEPEMLEIDRFFR